MGKAIAGRQALPVSEERLRFWRLERRLTQRGLDDKSGLSHSTISQVETGKLPRLIWTSIQCLAEALSIPPEELLDESSDYQVNQETTREPLGRLAREVAELSKQVKQLAEEVRNSRLAQVEDPCICNRC